MRILIVAATALATLGGPLSAADWTEFEKQSTSPVPPPAWRTQEPTREQMDEWRAPEIRRLLKLATDLELFVTEHPEDAHVQTARDREAEALYAAGRLGHPGAEKALVALDSLRLEDPKLPVDMRFAIRHRQVEEAARIKARESLKAGQTAFVDGARTLATEFPTRSEPWTMLIEMTDSDNLPVSRALLGEVLQKCTVPELRAYAEAMGRRYDTLGHALDWKFTALDGRAIDLQTLHDRVVLISFQATFNAASVAEMPELKQLYERYHEKGLEILSISFDEQPQLVQEFAREKGLSWPQGCDGQGARSVFVARYGIRALPTLWLVDKKGILRDLNGTRNLEDKVQLLLAEKGGA